MAAPLRWTCSWPDAGAQSFALYRGETATFEPRLKINGVVATNAEIAAVWYQTNGMANAWWRLDNATFAPSNDVGALSYRFFVGFRVPGLATSSQGLGSGVSGLGENASTPETQNPNPETRSSPETSNPQPETLYRANGTLRMLPSPGFSPNALPLPAKVLDFAEVEVENAPYYTKGEVDEIVGALDPAETDPVWEAEKGEYVKTSDLAVATVYAAGWAETADDAYKSEYLKPFGSFADDLAWVEYDDSGYLRIASRSNAQFRADTALDTPQVITNTVTKEFVEDLGIKPADPAYSWVRPDAWAIDVEIDKAEIAGTATVDESGTDAAGRVFTNVTYSTTYQMAAQCSPRMLDESSLNFPEIVSWAALPPGGTIDENGHFTAATSGLYRVSATASDGVTKYADVAISAERTVVTSNEYAYVDDDAAFLRNGCHTNALALLEGADTATTNYYGTTEYVVWNAYKPRFISTISGAGGTDRGPGDDRCFAVSAHILASASHHWPKKYNAQEFSDGANTYTVTKQVWVDLPTWAIAHGFTAAEAAAVNDLSLILCTGDAIPDACRPYFLTPEAFARRFGGDAAMLTGWRITQLSDWAMPIVFKYANFTTWYAWGDTRRDLRKLITDMSFDTYPAHGGDSGLPIFLLDGTREIVVAHHTSVAGCRADYVAGFRIIKAFVEAHGETLKEVE